MRCLGIILMWIAVLSYLGCKKEPQGYGDDQGCNCGTVCEDGIDAAYNCHWLMVENDCSGAQKRFCVDPLVWSAYHVGDRICINDQSPW